MTETNILLDNIIEFMMFGFGFPQPETFNCILKDRERASHRFLRGTY